MNESASNPFPGTFTIREELAMQFSYRVLGNNDTFEKSFQNWMELPGFAAAARNYSECLWRWVESFGKIPNVNLPAFVDPEKRDQFSSFLAMAGIPAEKPKLKLHSEVIKRYISQYALDRAVFLFFFREGNLTEHDKARFPSLVAVAGLLNDTMFTDAILRARRDRVRERKDRKRYVRECLILGWLAFGLWRENLTHEDRKTILQKQFQELQIVSSTEAFKMHIKELNLIVAD